MTAVLFVCTANICRSAYAEMVAAHRGSSDLDRLLDRVLPTVSRLT